MSHPAAVGQAKVIVGRGGGDRTLVHTCAHSPSRCTNSTEGEGLGCSGLAILSGWPLGFK